VANSDRSARTARRPSPVRAGADGQPGSDRRHRRRLHPLRQARHDRVPTHEL